MRFPHLLLCSSLSPVMIQMLFTLSDVVTQCYKYLTVDVSTNVLFLLAGDFHHWKVYTVEATLYGIGS